MVNELVHQAAKGRERQSKHLREMESRDRLAQLKIQLLREESILHEIQTSRKMSPYEESQFVYRQQKDIEIRKLKQQEMAVFKQQMESEEMSRLFKPKILNKSKMMYLKRVQQQDTVFERLNQMQQKRAVSKSASATSIRPNSKSPIRSSLSKDQKERLKLRQQQAHERSISRRARGQQVREQQKGFKTAKMSKLY